MRSFKSLSLLLAASIAVALSSSTVAATETMATGHSLTATRRHLRVQHGGVDDHDGEVASDAGIPGYVKAAAPQAPALAPAPVAVSETAPAPSRVAPAPVPVPQSQTATTTSVNVTPGTVSTNVNIVPGSSTTTVNGVSGGPAPQAVVAQPRPATAPAAAPAPAAKPATGGLGFDSLNPLTMVATLAHQAHGMLLGHTGTLPSSYMHGQSGGGHGH